MPLLKLVRLSGVFWVLAEVLAGYGTIRLIAGSGGLIGRLPYIMAAGVLLYAGMRTWADALDAQRDVKERPNRPIPAREITLTGAFLWGILLTAAGLLCAMVGGYACFYAAGVTMMAGFAHAAGAGRIEWIGPLLAGCARAGFWAMGMGLHPSLPYLDISVYVSAMLVGVNAAVAAALAMWAPPEVVHRYDLAEQGGWSVAADSRPADGSDAVPAMPGRFMVGGIGVTMLLVPVLAGWLLPSSGSWIVLAGWMALLGILLGRALSSPTPRRLSSLAVGGWIGGVWLDAAILAGYTRYAPVDLAGSWTLLVPGWADGAWIVGVWLLSLPAWRFLRDEFAKEKQSMLARLENA